MAQSQSECRMGAIFLESLFLEQIGAVVDRTISRPLPHRCFAIFSQYSYYNTSNNIKNSLTMPLIFSKIHHVTTSREHQHILTIFLLRKYYGHIILCIIMSIFLQHHNWQYSHYVNRTVMFSIFLNA